MFLIRINYSKKECQTVCDGCGAVIQENVNVCEVELGVEPLSNMAENIICLCRQCEKRLRVELNNIDLARFLSK